MKNTLLASQSGRNYKIIRTDGAAEFLKTLGFVPGVQILLLTCTRAGVTVRITGIKYALCRRLAANIIVE